MAEPPAPANQSPSYDYDLKVDDRVNHGVHFGLVVSEEVLSHSGDSIRLAEGEIAAEGSRAMGPYLFFRDRDGHLVEMCVDRGWRA